MTCDRRQFLAAASAGLLIGPRLGRGADEAPADLAYALDAEGFWRKLPFTDRLRKIAEAGYTRYEFGHWRTKDFGAIIKLNEEAGLQASRILAFAGVANPKRKESCLAAVEDAANIAAKLGANRITIIAGPKVEGVEPDDQVGAAVDALKESVDKLGESEATIILDPFEPPGSKGKPLFATFAEAVEAIKEVDSKRVRLLLDVDRIGPAEGPPTDLIAKHAESIGAYRVGPRPIVPALLRAIRKAGHAEPVGMALDPKADPLEAIRLLKEADAAAK